MLLAERLRHRFGAVTALDDVSFSVQPGQTLAVFGPNGAGKTTLLKVLAGLIQPQGGRAQVDGGRRAIGWIGHQPQLYAQLTVRENLRFWASLYDVQPPHDLLPRLGLAEHADRPVRALSRGLIQRVAIARALVHDPAVLLLDEPFTGLDRTAAEAFSRLLAQHAAAGRASVLVTHNVEEGTGLATEVAFMRAVFVVLVFVVFQFGHDPTAVSNFDLAPSILWVTFTFAAILALNRAFQLELENQALEGLLLAPIGRGSIYLGKLIANLAFVATIELIGLPLLALFFNVPVLPVLGPLAATIALATVGFVAVGTLFSAMTVRTRFAELLLPVLLLPFMILPLWWAVLATGRLLASRPLSEVAGWLNMLAVYDVVFVTLALLLFPATVNE